ncbi:MAG: ATP-binding protein [Candidatus Acidiferrales bacterium]
MPFSDFIGNEHIVSALRRMLAADRVPHALLFSGARGVGKFTLARMFAQAANCERHKDDFCGQCDPCRRTAALEDLQPLVERGLEERGADPDTATVERVPLILQPHPDVWAIVPDPVRLRNPVKRPVIRMGQLRAVQRAAYFRPAGRRRVFILDDADTMRWDYSNIFLKILEEPPESATLILIASNPYDLLETIRSRCLQFFFAPLRTEEVEAFLKERATGLKPAERKLAAQLTGGSPGAALALDLAESTRLRREVLRLVETAVAGQKMAPAIEQAERLAKDERQGFENLLAVFYSLLNDLLELSHCPGSCVLRNPDLMRELQALSKQTGLEGVARAVAQLDELHERLRRNISRQLGLDALAVTLRAAGEGRTAGPSGK